jgi:hypothetical protein
MLKRFASAAVIIFIVTGCRREFQKTISGSGEKTITGGYSVIENYEVFEGPHTGIKGSSSYPIRVLDDNRRRILLFENVARVYTLAGIRSGDSIHFELQKFPYYPDSVTISGNGRFSGDSLFLELISGGPAGLVKSECRAKKMY